MAVVKCWRLRRLNWINMKNYLFVIVLGLGPFHHSALATEVEDRLNQALKSLDSLQADFKQTVLGEDKNIIQQSSGKVSIQRPGKFAWVYLKPYEQQIIADGKELWIYDVDLDQATVKPMEAGLATAPIMVLMKQQPVETEFEVQEIGQREFLYWVELVPIKKDMEFSRVYIGLENELIKAMELRDNFGQSTQIVFENQRNNVIFNPDTFIFKPPPGVDVFGAGS